MLFKRTFRGVLLVDILVALSCDNVLYPQELRVCDGCLMYTVNYLVTEKFAPDFSCFVEVASAIETFACLGIS
jgi:hypothetical protein